MTPPTHPPPPQLQPNGTEPSEVRRAPANQDAQLQRNEGATNAAPPASKGAQRPRSEPEASEVRAPAKRAWTLLELIRWTTDHFASHGIDNPRLDAECLLASALGVDRMRLYLDFDRPADAAERAAFRELVKRRVDERVPVAQLLGHKEFWSLTLEVNSDVLVPRPDTETLVATALDLLPANRGPLRVLDVGTGSGAVALAIAKERPEASVTATDLSPAALVVARRNAEALGLGDRLRLLEGSLLEPVAGERFDLVVSNPPYLAESEQPRLAPELAHEPKMALFAGSDGLAVLRELVLGAPEVLTPGAGFAVEVAPAQAESVAQWCGEVGLRDVALHRDFAHRHRVVSARDSRPPEEIV